MLLSRNGAPEIIFIKMALWAGGRRNYGAEMALLRKKVPILFFEIPEKKNWRAPHPNKARAARNFFWILLRNFDFLTNCKLVPASFPGAPTELGTGNISSQFRIYSAL